MSEKVTEQINIKMSTQAFLILCRLFDGCYDDLKKQQEMEPLVEAVAHSMLGGVAFLHEQQEPPKEVAVALSFAQIFFLRKLVSEMYARFTDAGESVKTRAWLEECLFALEKASVSLQ